MSGTGNRGGDFGTLSSRCVSFLESKGQFFNFLLGILCVCLLAAFEISNHNEYFLSFIYLFPIALTSWLSGKSYGITLSVLATAILTVEKLVGADRLEPETRGYPRLTVKYGKQVNGVMESRFEKTKTV